MAPTGTFLPDRALGPLGRPRAAFRVFLWIGLRRYGKVTPCVERTLPWSGPDREQESERGSRPRPRCFSRIGRTASRAVPRRLPAPRQRLRAAAVRAVLQIDGRPRRPRFPPARRE